MNILVFSFRNTVAQGVAEALDVCCDKYQVNSNTEAIGMFLDDTDFAKYDYILGLGAYGGRDKDCLRVEINCNSKFRNSDEKGETMSIPYFLMTGNGIKLADGIGNSWCNLISYKILKKCPDSRYTFVHIPNSFDNMKAAQIINSQLVDLVK